MEPDSSAQPQPPKPKLLASVRHTVIVLLILLAIVASGAFFQRGGTASVVAVQRRGRLPLYTSIFIFQVAIFGYVWLAGLRRTGTRLRDLIGGGWRRWSDALLDLGVALGFWVVAVVILGALRFALGPSPGLEKAMQVLLPQGPVEAVCWVALSLTAGFCEEVVFRGYLQQQFAALTGSAAAGLLIQAAIFGISHGYQGIKPVIIITVYGGLFGLLAHWRGSLRPGMIAHGWQDIFSGFVVRFLSRHM